jgi:DNA-binding response OmpR family regulator
MARILLVDDEATVRELFALVLQLDAHEVTMVADGVQALEAIDESVFDLVITDLIMPDKEGIETIMEIRRLRPSLKIIAMSGGGRGSAGDYLAMASELGAARALEKPFSNTELRDAVRAVLAE